MNPRRSTGMKSNADLVNYDNHANNDHAMKRPPTILQMTPNTLMNQSAMGVIADKPP